MANQVPGDDARSDRISKRSIRRLLVLVTVLLVVTGAVRVATVAWGDDSGLTVEQLDEAQSHWRENGPASYDLEVLFESTDAEMTLRLEVRNGRLISGTNNGRLMSQSEAERWTIPAQFDRIRQDVIGIEDPLAGPNIRENAIIIPKARFDARLGYPTSYEFTGRGTPLQYKWRATHFEAVD